MTKNANGIPWKFGLWKCGIVSGFNTFSRVLILSIKKGFQINLPPKREMGVASVPYPPKMSLFKCLVSEVLMRRFISVGENGW